jgi:hypothetical protein
MSSLDHTPWRSGSPQGVRGALYVTGFPPKAVITIGGGVPYGRGSACGCCCCPDTGVLPA